MKAQDNTFIPLITVVSVLIPIAVAILMLLPGQQVFGDLGNLPLFHAVLNGMTAVLLCCGFALILFKKRTAHKICMVSALCLSSVFLVSYVVYHYNSGHVNYAGTGPVKTIYLTVLASHIVLATGIIPLALLTVYRGLTGNIKKHRKIARWTLPLWLYVAVTGVVIYVMMRESYALQ